MTLQVIRPWRAIVALSWSIGMIAMPAFAHPQSIAVGTLSLNSGELSGIDIIGSLGRVHLEPGMAPVKYVEGWHQLLAERNGELFRVDAKGNSSVVRLSEVAPKAGPFHNVFYDIDRSGRRLLVYSRREGEVKILDLDTRAVRFSVPVSRIISLAKGKSNSKAWTDAAVAWSPGEDSFAISLPGRRFTNEQETEVDAEIYLYDLKRATASHLGEGKPIRWLADGTILASIDYDLGDVTRFVVYSMDGRVKSRFESKGVLDCSSDGLGAMLLVRRGTGGRMKFQAWFLDRGLRKVKTLTLATAQSPNYPISIAALPKDALKDPSRWPVR